MTKLTLPKADTAAKQTQDARLRKVVNEIKHCIKAGKDQAVFASMTPDYLTRDQKHFLAFRGYLLDFHPYACGTVFEFRRLIVRWGHSAADYLQGLQDLKEKRAARAKAPWWKQIFMAEV